MSIGAARLFSSVTAISAYGVFITPGSLSLTDLPVGSATSNTATGNVTAGVGPFTFAWTSVSGDVFTINTPTSIDTTFTTFGTIGTSKSGTYRLTITDTGDGDAETTADINVSFEFAGDPS